MEPDPLTVVGYDGSADADAALLWAAAAARCRRAPLRVLIVASAMDPVLRDHHEASRRRARERKAQAGRRLREAGADADATVEIVEGPTYPVLLRSVGPGDLLVLGSRGHGLASGTFLGSVSQHVVRRSPCPVVVVRSPHATDARRITVGVDGSGAGDAALRWAADHGAVTGSELCAMSVCSSSTPPKHAAGAPDQEQQRQLDVAALTLQKRLAPIRRAHPEIPVTERIARGSAGQLLVEAGERSSLVVVGTRGRDPWAELALGSTAQYVLGRATCPVAVVRQWPPSDAPSPGHPDEAHQSRTFGPRAGALRPESSAPSGARLEGHR